MNLLFLKDACLDHLAQLLGKERLEFTDAGCHRVENLEDLEWALTSFAHRSDLAERAPLPIRVSATLAMIRSLGLDLPFNALSSGSRAERPWAVLQERSMDFRHRFSMHAQASGDGQPLFDLFAGQLGEDDPTSTYVAMFEVVPESEEEAFLSPFEPALGHFDEAIALLDAGGHVCYVNPAFEALTRQASSDLVTHGLGLLGLRHLAGLISRQVKLKEGWEGRLVVRRGSEGAINAKVTLIPLSWPKNAHHMALILQDTSIEIEIENHIHKAENLLAMHRPQGEPSPRSLVMAKG